MQYKVVLLRGFFFHRLNCVNPASAICGDLHQFYLIFLFRLMQVKEILTTKKITFLLLIMAAYQSVYIFLLYMYPGPPYNIPNQWRALFFNCSFSFPSFISFFLVLVSTTVLVVRLKQNLEWRNEAAKQSNQSSGGSKERKAARCVVAICTILILSFVSRQISSCLWCL